MKKKKQLHCVMKKEKLGGGPLLRVMSARFFQYVQAPDNLSRNTGLRLCTTTLLAGETMKSFGYLHGQSVTTGKMMGNPVFYKT